MLPTNLPEDPYICVAHIPTTFKFSDDMHFKCAGVNKGSAPLKWGINYGSGVFSDEAWRNVFRCPPHMALTGIDCKDSYCELSSLGIVVSEPPRRGGGVSEVQDEAAGAGAQRGGRALAVVSVEADAPDDAGGDRDQGERDHHDKPGDQAAEVDLTV